MNKEFKIYAENGYYIYKLENLITVKKISKNKVMRDTNTDYKVLQRLFTGELNRIDTTVLARLCDYLNCGITDIVEYFPNQR